MKVESVRELDYRDYKIRIDYDRNPCNPRTESDNLGTMVCSYRGHNLGDVPNLASGDAVVSHMYHDMIGKFWEDTDLSREQAVEACEKVGVVLPLYVYNHGGITMRTRSFTCQWDSGQVGYIYVSNAKLRKECSKPYRKRGDKILESEVQTYDTYLSGDVFGWTIIDPDGESVDSCWGYYDWKCIEQDVMPECKQMIDGYFHRAEEIGKPIYEVVKLDEDDEPDHETDYIYIKYVNTSGLVMWTMNNQLHRLDGPAIEYPSGDRGYYQGGAFIKLIEQDGTVTEQTLIKGWELEQLNETLTDHHNAQAVQIEDILAKETRIKELEGELLKRCYPLTCVDCGNIHCPMANYVETKRGSK